MKTAADPHRLTKDHPWWPFSTAAVAGFAAAVAMVPVEEQQALRSLRNSTGLLITKPSPMAAKAEAAGGSVR